MALAISIKISTFKKLRAFFLYQYFLKGAKKIVAMRISRIILRYVRIYNYISMYFKESLLSISFIRARFPYMKNVSWTYTW